MATVVAELVQVTVLFVASVGATVAVKLPVSPSVKVNVLLSKVTPVTAISFGVFSFESFSLASFSFAVFTREVFKNSLFKLILALNDGSAISFLSMGT